MNYFLEDCDKKKRLFANDPIPRSMECGKHHYKLYSEGAFNGRTFTKDRREDNISHSNCNPSHAIIPILDNFDRVQLMRDSGINLLKSHA